MRILIDTNVLIPLEPTRPEDVESGTTAAADLVRIAHSAGNAVVIHPNSLVDLQRDSDPDRRAVRDVLVRKYVKLESPPPLAAVDDVLGVVGVNTNDWVDHSLLAAVVGDAVDLLVTQDGGIHRKAARVRVADRVVTVEDAVALLRTLTDAAPAAPPAVESVPAHALDAHDSIFHSLREDYAEFDDWLTKTKRQGRDAWVILGPDDRYAGLCIIKQNDDDFRLGGKVLKLCTFKVAPEHQGNRYGELLLKTVFSYAHENGYDHLYVTVFDRHEGLITLLEEFGFYCLIGRQTQLGELVYAKDLTSTPASAASLPPLEFHVHFGPPAVKLGLGHVYVVPIEPRYHSILFPEGEAQTTLAVVSRPYGNALRKAYLCNAPIRRIERGDTVLFYRSHDVRSVTAVGVVDDVLVSRDADEIAAVVGQRTVYSYEDIRHLARREVVAILFRQDRLLRHPISLQELQANGAISRAPQSVTSVADAAIEWLAQTLGESCFSPLDHDSRTQSSVG
jgi:GNAT superfamily N-acetyltransferase